MTKKRPLGELAVEYVCSNPGATAAEVASALGAAHGTVAVILRRQESRSAIDSVLGCVDGTRTRIRRYYPATQHGEAGAVIRRAQEFGGPFGILAAQVMA